MPGTPNLSRATTGDGTKQSAGIQHAWHMGPCAADDAHGWGPEMVVGHHLHAENPVLSYFFVNSLHAIHHTANTTCMHMGGPQKHITMPLVMYVSIHVRPVPLPPSFTNACIHLEHCVIIEIREICMA